MVAEAHQKELEKYKKQIEKAYTFFETNYNMWHKQRRFLFETALSDEDREILRARQIPEIEFNNLQPYLERTLSEWWDQDPSVTVGSVDGQPVDPQLTTFIEGYYRNVLHDAKGSSTINKLLSDTMTGGFSTAEVTCEYKSKKTFKQVMRLRKNKIPTLTYYDPMAMDPHKGDGEFCGKYYPKTKDEFFEEFGKIDISEIKFYKESERGFQWAYKGEKDEEILIVCDHYIKKKKRKKLLLLANGEEIFEDEYKEKMNKFMATQPLLAAPAIVKTRWTNSEYIHRYVIIQDKIIKEEATDYEMLPFVFFDGNSAFLQNSDHGNMYQWTPSYFFHAIGIQRLRNFAGQNLANELENISQARYQIAIETIPEQEEYQESIRNPQSTAPLMWRSQDPENPDKTLPPPIVNQRVPIPPEITNTFTLSEQFTQAAFGSYDAQLGINGNQLSGRAIKAGAIQSSASSKPFLNNAVISLNRVAEIILHQIPKIHKTPDTIPVVNMDGTKSFIPVNQPGGLDLNYDPSTLNIKVEAGVSFEVQKSEALQTIFALMEASPAIAEFINSECLEEVLDNVDIRSIDSIKAKVPQYKQKMQQMQQMAAQQPNPDMLKAQAMQAKVQVEQAKVQHQMQQSQQDGAIEMAKIQVSQEEAETDRIRVLVEAHQAQQDNAVKLEKSQTERAVHALDFATEQMKHHHNVAKDMLELHLKRIGLNKERSAANG